MFKKGDLVTYKRKEYEILYLYSSGYAELREKKKYINFYKVLLVPLSQIRNKNKLT